MKNSRLKYLLSGLFALSLILASCSQAQEAINTDQPATTVEVLPPSESAITPETQVSAAEEVGSEPSQTAEVSEEKPTPRAGLVATDPSTVSLASGEIQLVEFFAFW